MFKALDFSPTHKLCILPYRQLSIHITVGVAQIRGHLHIFLLHMIYMHSCLLGGLSLYTCRNAFLTTCGAHCRSVFSIRTRFVVDAFALLFVENFPVGRQRRFLTKVRLIPAHGAILACLQPAGLILVSSASGVPAGQAFDTFLATACALDSANYTCKVAFGTNFTICLGTPYFRMCRRFICVASKPSFGTYGTLQAGVRLVSLPVHHSYSCPVTDRRVATIAQVLSGESIIRICTHMFVVAALQFLWNHCS